MHLTLISRLLGAGPELWLEAALGSLTGARTILPAALGLWGPDSSEQLSGKGMYTLPSAARILSCSWDSQLHFGSPLN